MKRLLLACVLCISCLAVNAESSWHIVVGADRMIPLTDVKALAAAPYESELYVLTNDGSQHGPYKEARFQYSEISAISEITDGDAPAITVGSELKLSHLKNGSHIMLYDISGVRLCEAVADSGEITIPLSSYEPGAYILVIDTASYKIIVK